MTPSLLLGNSLPKNAYSVELVTIYYTPCHIFTSDSLLVQNRDLGTELITRIASSLPLVLKVNMQTNPTKYPKRKCYYRKNFDSDILLGETSQF